MLCSKIGIGQWQLLLCFLPVANTRVPSQNADFDDAEEEGYRFLRRLLAAGAKTLSLLTTTTSNARSNKLRTNQKKAQIFKNPRQNSSSTHLLPPFFYASFCYESSAQQQPRGRQRHEEEEEEKSLIPFHHKTKRNRREAGSEAGSGIPHPWACAIASFSPHCPDLGTRSSPPSATIRVWQARYRTSRTETSSRPLSLSLSQPLFSRVSLATYSGSFSSELLLI